MAQTATAKPTNPLVPVAYTSGVLSGGVVGYDYAQWLNLPPAVGAVAGSIISTILTGILVSIIRDQKLRGRLVSFGAFVGAVVGAWAMMISEPAIENFLGGAIVGGVLGAIAGFLAFLLIILASLFLLLISRGPVSLYLRSWLANEQEAACLPVELPLDFDASDLAVCELAGGLLPLC